MRKLVQTLVTIAILIGTSTTLATADAATCETVRFGTTESPGMTFKTRLAAWMLEELGYKTEITSATISIVDNSLARSELDVFLGQWLPSQRQMLKTVASEGKVDIVTANVRGGNYTIGVPQYVYDQGVTSIKDLDKYKDKFGGTLYALGPGQGGTQTVEQMVKDDYGGLGDWDISKSYTAAMLAEVRGHMKKKEWIAFLAWRPHPMNAQLDIAYLADGEKYWGPNKGEVIINTVVRDGYAWQCLNVGQFLENYVFTTQEQSVAMQYTINEDMSDVAAGKKLIRDNPELLDRWLGRSGNYQTGGIKTADGEQDAKAVIAEALGM